MTLLSDKPDRWDAADATPEERRAIIQAALALEPEFTGRRPFRVSDWSTEIYMGASKPREWLVREVMPLGEAGMLAAAGGTGKGFLLLDLALKVAARPPAGIDTNPPLALGCTVSAHGAAVILSAEDNQDEILRRLVGIDPHRERRKRAGGRLHVIPMPDIGGAQALVTQDRGNPAATDFYAILCDQLRNIPDIRLVVIDPLASFVHCDINSDPQAAAYCMSLLASMATETGATVLVAHHMSKGDAKRPVHTVDEARALVRGTTGLVDGLRFVYAVWPTDHDKARRLCRTLDIEWNRNMMFDGAVVKSNGPADDTIRTYQRDKASGLLTDITGRIQARQAPPDELRDALIDEILMAAADGHPFSNGGKDGLFARKHELRSSLDLSRNRLEAMVKDLLAQKMIVECHPVGRTHSLDVPDGAYAMGLVTRTDRAARKLKKGETDEQ